MTPYETTLRIFRISVLALSLLVLRVLTDNSDRALSFDDLTFLANWFYGRSNLHFNSLLSKKVRLLFYHGMQDLASTILVFFGFENFKS